MPQRRSCIHPGGALLNLIKLNFISQARDEVICFAIVPGRLPNSLRNGCSKTVEVIEIPRMETIDRKAKDAEVTIA